MTKPSNRLIKIGGSLIGDGQPVFIIAEGGVNHNGRLDLALKLVDAAADAGAQAIKFQTWRAEQLVTRTAEMADYQKKNLGTTESQFEMLKKLELKNEFYPRLLRHAAKKKITLLSTPHGGFEAVDFLVKMKSPALKFGSGDLTNLPLLEYAARFRKPMLVSTGMATWQEVEEALHTIRSAGNDQIVLFHCTTNYPCPPKEANLLAMRTMIDKLPAIVGYSDHTIGSQAAVMAVALGARVIEKHLTLDRGMKGPDHKSSAEPQEFKETVKAIREAEAMLGSSVKKPVESEIRVALVARKSVVATADIKRGELFTVLNIGIKRPGSGLHPREYFRILNKKSRRNIKADSLIQRDDYQ